MSGQQGYVNIIFPYGIDKQYEGAFIDAAAFWNNIITSGSPPSELRKGLDVSSTQCGVDYEFPPGAIVEGLQLFASIPFIDGPGAILGRAGPCVYHGSIYSVPLFPMLAIMEFDSADSQKLLDDGQFGSVILHEMGHTFGIGTLWPAIGLLKDPCPLFVSRPCDPFYIGAEGIKGYKRLNDEETNLGELPPVANTGGTGTANGHWREISFENELMTGYLNSGVHNPVSIMTILSIKDLGYSVETSAAEPYSIPVGASPYGRDLPENSIQLFGDTFSFDIEAAEELGERFPSRTLNENETKQTMTGLFVALLFGFFVFAGFINFIQKRHNKEMERILVGKKVGTASPMHRV